MIAAPLSSVYPGMGGACSIICFVVVVIGGIGSITGALIASLLVGFVDTFGKVFFAEFSGIGVYLLMAVILVWRPEGLMKRSIELELALVVPLAGRGAPPGRAAQAASAWRQRCTASRAALRARGAAGRARGGPATGRPSHDGWPGLGAFAGRRVIALIAPPPRQPCSPHTQTWCSRSRSRDLRAEPELLVGSTGL